MLSAFVSSSSSIPSVFLALHECGDREREKHNHAATLSLFCDVTRRILTRMPPLWLIYCDKRSALGVHEESPFAFAAVSS
jgi:hypothetical protein